MAPVAVVIITTFFKKVSAIDAKIYFYFKLLHFIFSYKSECHKILLLA
jgi:hypothetical protein